MKDWRMIWRRQKSAQRAWKKAEAKLGVKVPKPPMGKPAKIEMILAVMHPGRKFSAEDDFAGELRRLHGDDPEISPEKIKARCLAKIAREEAIEREVRKKYNPGYDPLKSSVKYPDGVAASEIVRAKVNADVLTIRDKNEMSRKWGWFLTL